MSIFDRLRTVVRANLNNFLDAQAERRRQEREAGHDRPRTENENNRGAGKHEDFEDIGNFRQSARDNGPAKGSSRRSSRERNNANRSSHERPSSESRRRPSWNHTLAQYYANLELPYGSSPKEVKAAWRRLMKRFHPDLHSSDSQKQDTANALCQELTKARKETEKAWREGLLK